MSTTQIVSTVLPIVVALLSLWKAYLERKGKKEMAEVVDAVIDGVEGAGDPLTKDKVSAYAAKAGVTDALNLALDGRGYRVKATR